MHADETQTIFFVEYLDGTYAECKAQDADDALDQMSRDDTEMAHSPIKGRAPTGENIDRYFTEAR